MKREDDNPKHSQEHEQDKVPSLSMIQNMSNGTGADDECRSMTEDTSLASTQRRAPQHANLSMSSAPKQVPPNVLGGAVTNAPLVNTLALGGNNLLQQLGLQRLMGVEFGRQQQLVQLLLHSSQKREEEMNAQIRKAASILSVPPGKAAQATSSPIDPLQGSVSGTNADAPDNDTTKMPAGSVLVPCRARGMPRDHNSKTAFFIIPNKIAHGEGLRCSHVACRNRGIRFRYCSVCSLPVAKRNFSTRHHHGNVVGEPIKNSDGAPASQPMKTSVKVQSSSMAASPAVRNVQYTEIKKGGSAGGGQKTTNNKESSSTNTSVSKRIAARKRSGQKDIAFTTEVSTSTSTSTGSSIDTADGGRGSQHESVQEQTKPAVKTSEGIASSEGFNPGFLREKRTLEWLELLNKRPRTDSGDAMSAWLMQVMSVSNQTAPYEQENNEGCTDSSSPTDESGNAGSGRSDGSSVDDYSRNHGGTDS